MKKSIALILLCTIFNSFSQTKDAYDNSSGKKISLFDPSRLTVQHSLSFGMSSTSGFSNMKSLSQYTTMLQYSFVAPVTLNLNFSLPIYSSFSSYNNLTKDNLLSMEYFKNLPFDIGVTWKPSENFQFNFNISKYTQGSNFYDPFYPYQFNSLTTRLSQPKQ